jgi:hypothetical protein
MRMIAQYASRQATDDDLLLLEALIGNALPEQCRRFIRQANGGKPDVDFTKLMSNTGRSESFKVRAFYSLDPSDKYYYLISEIEAYDDRLPQGMLPVACDDLGNLVLLSYDGQNSVAVYFWDHEREHETDTMANVSLLAPDFQTFVNSLSTM